MKNSKIFFNLKFIFLALFFNFQFLAQTNLLQNNIDSLFSNYTEEYKEVTYAHLNKSIYLQGEVVGFTIYVLQKHLKKLSPQTKNVYVKIYDVNKTVVKEQLIKVNNGVATGTIVLDKEFTKGNYTFVAFTNWMLNFKQQNIFNTNFKILDIESNTFIDFKTAKDESLDVQLLPESGHFLDKVINSVGVIVKDSRGFGVPNLKGIVISNQDTILKFKLNSLGIGRFSLLLNRTKNFKVVFNFNGKKLTRNFPENIANKGILLNVKEINKMCYASLKTNENTLSQIKNRPYLLTFHNGKSIKKLTVNFKDNLTITKKIPLTKLSSGITVFTIFDAEHNPISERLFFNYNNISILKSKNLKAFKKDSIIDISLDYGGPISNFKFNNVSVSILPENTKSYKHNHNIISQVFLKPYVNGIIENGSYYFKEFNKKTKYDLDNLLITQGWSSYKWDSIFFSSEKPKNYQFEEGLTVKINIAEKEKIQKLFLHGTKYSPSKFIDVTNNTKEFDISNLYLFENQELNISKLDFRGKLGKPNLDVNFYPSKIPELSIKNFYALPVVESYTFESLTEINNFSKLNNSEVLEGISLTTNLEKVRRTKIKSEAFGRVFFVDKFQKKLSLVNYLNSKPGIFALDDSSKGQLVVINKRTLENLRLVLNGLQVSESLLFNYWMDDVDYIEIETTPPLFSQKTHSGGTVSIKTKGNTFRRRNITISNFEIPLTFTKEKKFYTPKYESYNYAFFRNYGVIDWQPINKINKNGLLQIQLKDIPFKSFKLFIEGITKDGHFISEEKVLKIE